MNLFTCYNPIEEKEEDPTIEVENIFNPSMVKDIGTKIYDNQLKTQSQVTSIYGCNLVGAHEEIVSDEVYADDIEGKQLVLMVPNVKVTGFDIGSLVIANIGKAPPPKVFKEWNGKQLDQGMELEVIDEEHFQGEILPSARLSFDCKVRHLTITNCSNVSITIEGRIRTSVELIKCTNVKVKMGGFYFIRITNSDSVKIWGQVSRGGIFDIRNSASVQWFNITVPCNEYTSQRFKYNRDSKTLVPIDTTHDMFALHGSHSFPTTQIGWNFR